jgi:signal transduction histidine kinase
VRHPSIRLRLTLMYAAVLVATCAGLLALNYGLLYHRLYTDLSAPNAGQMQKLEGAPPEAAERAQADLALYLARQAEIVRLRHETMVTTVGTSAAALTVTALLGVGVCWIVAGRMLKPLRTLTAATRRISQDRLHERVALTGPPDELKELADTFDDMVSRLEASFASQRRFVADAAHELRTPLAITRTGAEVQLAKRTSTPEQWEDMARRVLTATGRAERMLDGLLALARSDNGVFAAGSHDLAVAAATALGDADEEAERAELTAVNGDPALLDRLASNLIDNAVRHNQPGGRLEVLTGSADDGVVVLTVRNSGEHIPADEVDRLFEPFQRFAQDRPAGARSTGLGLAIVRSIVRAHGGLVTATPNDDGGLTVTVTLPAGS